MRKPPKRNMKTKSAVLPRKEPSSSMRQYLYLREKQGLQYRKPTAGHAGCPQHHLPGTKPATRYGTAGSCQPAGQSPQRRGQASPRTTDPKQRKASPPRHRHCSPGRAQQHCRLLQPVGRGCSAASRHGSAGRGDSCWGNGFGSDQKSQRKNPQP